MSLDYRSALEAQAWALLEASAAFTAAFKAGNRIKASGDGWLRERAKGAPADYPQLKIELRGGSDQAAPKVFAMNSTSYASSVCDVPIPMSQQLALIFTYDKLKTGDQTPLETIAEKVLRAKWPKFGLAYVTNFSMSTTRRELQVSGSAKQQTTLLMNFNLRPMLSQLSG